MAKYGRLVAQNCDQAKYLETLVAREPDLTIMAPVPLNIVCFRFAPRGLEDARADAVNEEILYSLQESGTAVPSSTTLRGRFSIRVCLCNHRTRREDLDRLVREVLERGRAALGAPAGTRS